MSFSDDFASCLAPLPAPSIDGLNDLLEWIDKLHTAWESSGGDDEMLLSTLVAAGAVTGIDEAALGTAAALTVGVYISACVSCAVTVAASSIWDAISSTDSSYLKQLLTVAANDKGIKPPDSAMA